MTGQFPQPARALSFKLQPLRFSKNDLPAEVRRAFSNERLRREERIDRELNPTAIPDKIFLKQRVIDMMAWVTLVRSQVNRAIM